LEEFVGIQRSPDRAGDKKKAADWYLRAVPARSFRVRTSEALAV
jgi:hypothetical protein